MRRDDVARLLVAIAGRALRPFALRRIAYQTFGRDGSRVVGLARSRGAIVLDARGYYRVLGEL